MQFVKEIWEQMASRYVESFKKVVPDRMTFDRAKGEQVIPRSLVNDMITDAYKQGATDALKMTAEIDGPSLETNEKKSS